MRFLVCPQCGIDRFFILDGDGNRRLVKVTREYVVIPIDPEETLDGFNLEVLHCLGCSWKGSKNRLVKYLT